MARIRTVKPELFRHEELQDIETSNPGSHAMLTFIGLFTASDKNGTFPWRPRQLKLDILPFLSNDIDKTLELLLEAGLLRKFTNAADNKEYGVVVNFTKHQRINGKEAQEPPKYPPPPQQGSTGEATGKQLPAQEREREREIGKDIPPTPLEGGGEEDAHEGLPPGGGPDGDFSNHSLADRKLVARSFFALCSDCGRINGNDEPGKVVSIIAVLLRKGLTWRNLELAWQRYTDAHLYNTQGGKEFRLPMQKFLTRDTVTEWMHMPEGQFRKILESNAAKSKEGLDLLMEKKLGYGKTYDD